jgi:uncharacterized protein (DUF305 family)
MRALVVIAAAALLSACDGGGDPVQQAMREASTANHAAQVKAGAVSGPPHADHAVATGPTEADRAFAASEAEMHRLMAEASGATLDQSYIAKMIAHHQGAVAMAEVALRDSRDPEVRRMAQAVVEAQTREIAEMRAWTPSAAQ